MDRPDIERAIAYALHRLEHELDPRLRYHSIAHTRDDVVPAVERLAALAQIGDEPLLLLRTAAYFHDIGFIELREGHEAVSMRIARAKLPEFGYSSEQIAAIAGMIAATRLPQSPTNQLEQLLADADLDSLGRSDFMARNSDLRTELESYGASFDDRIWFANQLSFVENHHYWTQAANALRETQKQLNIFALRGLVAKHENETPV